MTEPITPEPTPEREVDVEAMHRGRLSLPRPLQREAPEPVDGNEPTPWWMWVLAVSALFIGGFYLGRHGGTFSARPHIGFTRSADHDDRRPELARPATGEELYAARCASCHQPDAHGLAGTFPPLVGSEWVVGRPEVPVRIVLLGLTGPMQVQGQTYGGTMPTWGPMMTDDEIASVLTHVRALSNASPIDAELVARERKATAGTSAPLTAESLAALVTEPP